MSPNQFFSLDIISNNAISLYDSTIVWLLPGLGAIITPDTFQDTGIWFYRTEVLISVVTVTKDFWKFMRYGSSNQLKAICFHRIEVCMNLESCIYSKLDWLRVIRLVLAEICFHITN